MASDLELTEAPALLDELQDSQLVTPDDQLRSSCWSLILGNRFGTLAAIEEARAAAQLVDLVTDPYLRTAFRNVYAYVCGLRAITGGRRNRRRVGGGCQATALGICSPYCALARSIVAIGLRRFDDALQLLATARDDAHELAIVS